MSSYILNKLPKILIIGASGFVGRYLLRNYSPQYNFLFTYNKNYIDGGIKYNALNDDIEKIINIKSLDAVILIHGDTRPDSCFFDSIKSDLLNVVKTCELIQIFSNHNIYQVFASTEFVFDGKKSKYKECDTVNPILLYGLQKLKVENYLKNNIETYSILRFSKVYGSEIMDGSFLTDCYAKLLSGSDQMRVATDQWFTAVYVDDICKALLHFCSNKINGLYHAGGPDRLSRFEYTNKLNYAMSLNGVIKMNESRLVPCSIDEFNLPEKRPKDVSLCSDKLIKELNFSFKNVDEVIDRIINSKRMYA
jgi:dTDP-4-dehydrorhamnose reductase